MSRIAIPALIVMVAVAALVGVAGWNASADPRQVITLTERELSFPYYGARSDEEPALQLVFEYQGRYDPLESRNWLPETRLREIGFSLDVPAGSPQAVYTYDRVPSRVTWVVLEYDGPAFRDIERRRALQPEHLRPTGLSSRLVPVDAGPDYQRLAARYPSGHLIVRGEIGLSYVSAENGGPLLHGTLRQIVPARVAVPSQYRALFEQLGESARPVLAPRYEAELAVGRLGLPYLRSVRLAGGN